VKCAIVAEHCGHPVGSHVVWHAPKQKEGGQTVMNRAAPRSLARGAAGTVASPSGRSPRNRRPFL
jgi:hypothetical protein